MSTSEEGEREMLQLVSRGPGNMSATSILKRREHMRANKGGLLLPPPPPDVFARAKMAEPPPGETISKPNDEMQIVLVWLQSIHDFGGSPEDIMRAFQAWDSPFKQAQAKLPARDFVERLVASARSREVFLQRRAEKETRPQLDVDKYRSFVEAQAAKIKKAETDDINGSRAELARLRSELERAEERLKASTA